MSLLNTPIKDIPDDPNVKIIKVTHNGKPQFNEDGTVRKGGGRFVGYQVVDLRPARTKSTSQTATVREPEIYYLDLPMAKHSDGECLCGHYPNTPLKEVNTTTGREKIVICNKCRKKMRPWKQSC